jgi:hypothetical protein
VIITHAHEAQQTSIELINDNHPICHYGYAMPLLSLDVPKPCCWSCGSLSKGEPP